MKNTWDLSYLYGRKNAFVQRPLGKKNADFAVFPIRKADQNKKLFILLGKAAVPNVAVLAFIGKYPRKPVFPKIDLVKGGA